MILTARITSLIAVFSLIACGGPMPAVARAPACDYSKLISEPSGILFRAGLPRAGDDLQSALAGDDSVASLQRNSDLLRCSWYGVPMRVEGFTDPSECSGAQCEVLSQRRAQLFHDWLVAHGVGKDRLLAPVGKGNSEPIREPGTPDAARFNARAYIRIAPVVDDSEPPRNRPESE